MTTTAPPPAAYRQGVFDAVAALSAGLDLLAHAERLDPCASDQAAQAARHVRRMGRALRVLLDAQPDATLDDLPASFVLSDPAAV